MSYRRRSAAGSGPGLTWVAVIAIAIILLVVGMAMSTFGFFGVGEGNLPSTPIPLTPDLPSAPGLKTEIKPEFTR